MPLGLEHTHLLTHTRSGTGAGPPEVGTGKAAAPPAGCPPPGPTDGRRRASAPQAAGASSWPSSGTFGGDLSWAPPVRLPAPPLPRPRGAPPWPPPPQGSTLGPEDGAVPINSDSCSAQVPSETGGNAHQTALKLRHPMPGCAWDPAGHGGTGSRPAGHPPAGPCQQQLRHTPGLPPTHETCPQTLGVALT